MGSHYWQVYPSLELAEADLDTGEVSTWQSIYNGSGLGHAPEGPHVYYRNGWYYLLDAEGGTGVDHMVTVARSRNLTGPYESDSANPELTNANTSSYFQTIGHADLFQDPSGNWWGVALSTRSGPTHVYYPMGRETVLTAVTWSDESGAFPVWTNISGDMSVWAFPPVNKDVGGSGPFIDEGDDIDFAPNSTIPPHFTYYRFPNASCFVISPDGHPNTFRLFPSTLNLTGLDGNSAFGRQTYVGRRQQDTLFTYQVSLDYSPSMLDEEAGVTVFLTQNHHLDLGVVQLSANESTTRFSGTTFTQPEDPDALVPHIRYRGISSVDVPEPIVAPIPDEWANKTLMLEVQASNMTHYTFSIGPADAQSQMQTLLYVANDAVSYGFTGEPTASSFFSLLIRNQLADANHSLVLARGKVRFWVYIVPVMEAVGVRRRTSRTGNTYLKDSLLINNLLVCKLVGYVWIIKTYCIVFVSIKQVWPPMSPCVFVGYRDSHDRRKRPNFDNNRLRCLSKCHVMLTECGRCIRLPALTAGGRTAAHEPLM